MRTPCFRNSAEDPTSQKAYAHLKAGSIKGLSIGFSLPRGDAKTSYRDGGVRVLREVFVHEVSLVPTPANPRALVTTVKTLAEARLALKSLIGDISEDQLLELREIDRELKRLLVGRDSSESHAATLTALKAFATELKQAM
jgi:hypothetical protein